MTEAKEEVLFMSYDSGWGCELPVTLLKFSDGSMDLHSQTGPDWDSRILRAEEILKQRGLKLKTHNPEFIGPTGGYMTVTQEKTKMTEAEKAAGEYRRSRYPNKREPQCYETSMAYEVGDEIEEAFIAGAEWQRERDADIARTLHAALYQIGHGSGPANSCGEIARAALSESKS